MKVEVDKEEVKQIIQDLERNLVLLQGKLSQLERMELIVGMMLDDSCILNRLKRALGLPVGKGSNLKSKKSKKQQ